MHSRPASLPTILVAFAAFNVCAWLAWNSAENLQSGSWPRTDGDIESVRVFEERGSRGGVQHTIDIKYRFTVAGQVYTGDRFNTRNNYLAGEAGAIAVQQTHRPGGPCSVAYHPNDPARCFIDTSITWHTWFKLGLAVIVGAAGIVFLFFGVRDILRAGKPSS
jgi:hypothetical protein